MTFLLFSLISFPFLKNARQYELKRVKISSISKMCLKSLGVVWKLNRLCYTT